MAGISIRKLTKRYTPTTPPVLDSIDLEIADGDFVVLVGPSGCGKTTLLRIIAGLEDITDGDIHIGETLVNNLSPADRDIAFVFQDYALYPHFTVRQNMAFGLEIRKTPKEEIQRRIDYASGFLQIGHLLDRKPRALSGGQRQRVAMGRAIVREPKVFLFDEPLSNLDAKLRVEVRAEIRKLFEQFKKTMVYVTHDQVEAMTMADRIVVLKDTIIQQVGSPREVYTRPVNKFVAEFIGSPSMNFFKAGVDGGAVVLAGGTRIALPAALAGPLAKSGLKEVDFGIRPEDFRLDPNGPLSAKVAVVEPLGSDTLVFFSFDGKEYIARVDPEAEPRTGQRITLNFNAEKCHIFSPESGKAIR